MLQFDNSKRIDNLGRLTIPKKICESLGMSEGDGLRLSISNDKRIIISLPCNSCVACGSKNNLQKIKYWFICDTCINETKTKNEFSLADLSFPIVLQRESRISIPQDIRDAFKINSGDLFRISVENNKIYLKHIPGSCSLCGGKIDSEDSYLCKNCLNQIKTDTYLA